MDYQSKWSYRWYRLKLLVTNKHVQTKFMTILFVILAVGLLLQASYVTDVFHPHQQSTIRNIQITTPIHVFLENPFSISLASLHPGTTYSIFFITTDYGFNIQEQFTANSTYYQTQLTASAQDCYSSTLLRLGVQTTTGSLVGSVNITVI